MSAAAADNHSRRNESVEKSTQSLHTLLTYSITLYLATVHVCTRARVVLWCRQAGINLAKSRAI